MLVSFLNTGKAPDIYSTQCSNESKCPYTNFLLSYVAKSFTENENGLQAMPGWWEKCPQHCQKDFILYDLLCSISKSQDIVDELERIDDFRSHICIDHLIERRDIPKIIANEPVSAYLIKHSPRSSPPILMRLKSTGINTNPKTINNISKGTNPKTLMYLLETYPGDSIVISANLIANLCHQTDENLYLIPITILILHGFRPSNAEITTILKKCHFEPSPCSRFLLNYIREEYTSKTKKFDPVLFSYLQGQGPSNEAISILMETSTCDQDTLLDICTSEIANLNYWILYFHNHGLIQNMAKEDFSKYTIRIDQQLLNHIFSPSINRTLVASKPLPPFGTSPSDILILVQGSRVMRVKVYMQYLSRDSGLLSPLIPRQSPKKRILIKIPKEIPTDITKPKLTLKNWIAHCYTGLLPKTVTLRTILDLKSLAEFMVDESCLLHTIQWIRQYHVENYNEHKFCENDCELCRIWKS